jgi:hypothetical protein
MHESERSPTPQPDDDALLECLRELARECDAVPEEVLAAARSVFPRTHDDHGNRRRRTMDERPSPSAD